MARFSYCWHVHGGSRGNGVMLKKILLMMSVFALGMESIGAETAEQISYVPNIHGVMRARWELDTEHGDNRFQMRNARVSLDGKIAPWIEYFIQTDFCDAGVIKILDAYGRFKVVDGMTVQTGQFRMPFGVETFRGPQNYIFANRSFMGKQIMNYRAVGAKVAYTLPKVPFTLEFGAFNPKSIGNHTPWNRTVAYSAKASYKVGDVAFSAGYASIKPFDVRANLLDGAVVWDDGRHWLVGGEYMFKHYVDDSAADVHSWVGFVDWHMPVKAGIFNRWSVQARGDGMTDHLTMDGLKIEPARERITIGSTLTYSYKIVHADVRLNYEKYFYHNGYRPSVGDTDRLVAELVIRF